MEGNKKLIDYRLYNPKNSLFGSKKDKAKFRTLYCTASDVCRAYKNNTCTMWKMGGSKCPYASMNVEEGFTQRARKFHSWVSERKERVKDIKQLKAAGKIELINEYIYFPYAHWYLDKSVPVENKGGYFSNGPQFFLLDVFTIDLFQKIVNARPHAMMGGEITSYQKEVVPKIVMHTEEQLPDFFNQWKDKYKDTYERFKVKDYVGRLALVKTLKKGTKIQHKYGNIIWDGKYAVIDNFDLSFSPIKEYSNASLKLTLEDNASIKITSNDQVSGITKFVD